MDILIVGTGYVGLVTGTCFAEMGHSVTCLDVDEKKIEMLNKGIVPIYEQGLEELIKKNKKQKRLFFTTNYKDSVEKAEVCFISVPTPSGEDGSCNLSYIKAASENIGKYLNDYKVIVIKSTAIVGTAFEVKNIIKEELKKRNVALEFDIVSNPEFLRVFILLNGKFSFAKKFQSTPLNCFIPNSFPQGFFTFFMFCYQR